MRWLAALSLLITACNSVVTTAEGPGNEPTPAQWAAPSILRFRVLDANARSLGTFVIELTSEPAPTCISGTWFKGRPVSSDLKVPGFDLAKWWSDPDLHPAYSINGRRLVVQLNGGRICDDYPEVQAELGGRTSRGSLRYGGIFASAPVGRVVIEKLP
jgi:hypothetical protein